MKNVEQKNSNGGTVMGEKTYPVNCGAASRGN